MLVIRRVNYEKFGAVRRFLARRGWEIENVERDYSAGFVYLTVYCG